MQPGAKKKAATTEPYEHGKSRAAMQCTWGRKKQPSCMRPMTAGPTQERAQSSRPRTAQVARVCDLQLGGLPHCFLRKHSHSVEHRVQSLDTDPAWARDHNAETIGQSHHHLKTDQSIPSPLHPIFDLGSNLADLGDLLLGCLGHGELAIARQRLGDDPEANVVARPGQGQGKSSVCWVADAAFNVGRQRLTTLGLRRPDFVPLALPRQPQLESISTPTALYGHVPNVQVGVILIGLEQIRSRHAIALLEQPGACSQEGGALDHHTHKLVGVDGDRVGKVNPRAILGSQLRGK
mmetsp:Transcript_18195/g.40184  ORF Transcript_18195/g.40184 Transcript_18195/m.40184 type:complete len:293 (+) Transcript_18195:3-881(+)